MKSLRGHHLFCLHFYDGEGYDEPFIANLEEVLARIVEEGVQVLARIVEEGVQVADGADDVCAPCPHRRQDRCTFSRTADREIRQMDEKALALLGLRVGRQVRWELLRDEAAAVFAQWYATFCFACGWHGACEKRELFRKLQGRQSGL